MDVVNKLKSMEREINRRLSTSFLKAVSIDYRNTDISLVFTMGSGYKEIYKYYLMLQKGLSINNNILSLSMKEFSLLYEYWCFIKILYTTEFLLKNAKIVTELCIKSKEEYRLWQELKRINSVFYTKGEKLIGNESKVKGFSIDGIDVTVTKDEIVVGKDRVIFSKADFSRKPRVVMQEIMRVLKENI